MSSFGRINDFLALAKCLKPWDWLFSPNEVDEGGKPKVRGLKLIVAGTFLRKLTIVFSCVPIGLIIAVGIQHHGLKIGLWVSWLKLEGLGPRKYFGGLYTYKMAYPTILYVGGNCLH